MSLTANAPPPLPATSEPMWKCRLVTYRRYTEQEAKAEAAKRRLPERSLIGDCERTYYPFLASIVTFHAIQNALRQIIPTGQQRIPDVEVEAEGEPLPYRPRSFPKLMSLNRKTTQLHRAGLTERAHGKASGNHMSCPDCGGPAPEESAFCSHCGAKLREVPFADMERSRLAARKRRLIIQFGRVVALVAGGWFLVRIGGVQVGKHSVYEIAAAVVAVFAVLAVTALWSAAVAESHGFLGWLGGMAGTWIVGFLSFWIMGIEPLAAAKMMGVAAIIWIVALPLGMWSRQRTAAASRRSNTS